ncbi:MAG: hypothetical protein GY794_16195 [bacterium]|nr:hypothetical protein [bacterium]
MAKMIVNVDVKLGPAVKVILRMITAFGTGIQAEEVDKAGALAEAYAFIEQNLQTQIPSRDPIKDTVEANDGEYVDVLMKNGGELNGRIDSDKSVDGYGFFLVGKAVRYLRFIDVEHVTIVKSKYDSWRGDQGKLPLIEFLSRNVGERVLIEQGYGDRQPAYEFTGRLTEHDDGDGRRWWSIVTDAKFTYTIDLDTIRFARKLPCAE